MTRTLTLVAWTALRQVVRGDGNCQYRAFADQLYKRPDRHEEVRKAVIKQLRKHADQYKCASCPWVLPCRLCLARKGMVGVRR